MPHEIVHRLLVAGVLAGAAAAAAAGGYERLSQDGPKVLSLCGGGHPAATDGDGRRCRVDSLPGEPGYRIVAARTAPIVYNDVRVGTLQERVWQSADDPAMHVFGVRIALNAEAWDSSGSPFRVNDLFRQALPKQRVSVAYKPVVDAKPLLLAGRTLQGLNEIERRPERNNAWVDFRIDVGVLTASGAEAPNSPWLLMKARAPKGVEIAPFGLRLLNSDVADPLDAVDLFTTSYQPVGVPPPDDDDDDDDQI